MTIAVSKEANPLLGLQLYDEQKYPIIQGFFGSFQKTFQNKEESIEASETNHGHIALCTCWTDTQGLLKTHPTIQEHFQITGTLYSIEGVSILLRNLLLNPHIQYVLIWRKSPLSNTDIGKKAWEALFTLWEHGITEDSQIVGTNYFLHKEIDVQKIREVIKDVNLVDVSNQPMEQILSNVEHNVFSFQEKQKRPRYDFPAPTRDALFAFPSEQMGFLVQNKKIVSTWLLVVDRILRYGKVKATEYGSQQKELQGISWVIEDEDIKEPYFPDWQASLRDMIGLDKKALQKYKEYFLSAEKKEGVAYTYGERLRDYDNSVDQIQKIIEKLRNNKATRRGIAITFNPHIDYESLSPPCLNQIQVITDASEQKLNLIATFRSHDVFKAGIPNAFGLLALQDYIAKELSLQKGSLMITSHSAHIYEEEWQSAKDIVQCQVWERVQTRFNEHTDLDPRGIVRISVRNGLIHTALLSYEGEELFSFAEKNARDIVMKIAKLNLLSKPDHYCDVTIELLKAEIAMKTNQSFQQDKSLKIENAVIR